MNTYNSDYIKDETLEALYNLVKEENKDKLQYDHVNIIVKDNIDMHKKKHEVFRVLFLDSGNRKVKTMEFKGIANQCIAYPSKIIKTALSTKTVSIIIMHNHPGKSSVFSHSDLQITRKIYVACKSMELNLLDHILFHGDGHKGIRENSSLWYDVSKSIY